MKIKKVSVLLDPAGLREKYKNAEIYLSDSEVIIRYYSYDEKKTYDEKKMLHGVVDGRKSFSYIQKILKVLQYRFDTAKRLYALKIETDRRKRWIIFSANYNSDINSYLNVLLKERITMI